MKLACNTRMVSGNSFGEKLATIERYGFEGVEVRLLEEEATPQHVEEVAKALAQSALGVGCIIVPGPVYAMPIDSEETKWLKLASVRKSLEIGATLGGPVMVTPEYCPQSPLPLWERRKPLSPRESELLLSFLSEVAEMAEELSVMVVLEPINRYEGHYYNRLEEAVEIIDRVGSPRLKIDADFFHMQIEERDIAAAIEKAAGYIYHVQLGDSNRELPGLGHTDFRAGFAALRRIGYDRYMALECRVPDDPERELPECVRFLRQCLEDSKRTISSRGEP